MSEPITIGTGTITIYGTFAGAVAYHDLSGSEASDAFGNLADDDARKKKLVDATRFLNSLAYDDDYTTFAARDALDLGTGDGDEAFPFRKACYLLAGLAAADPDVLVVDDQGSNIARVYAGGAGVDFFNPTSAKSGTATVLPGPVLALIAEYLATEDLSLGDSAGETGSDENPFGPCADYDRTGSW